MPFVVSGVTICLVLTRYSSRSVSRLYAADLAGAALGCVLLIGVLNWSDGPTAVLWVAMLASLGAVAFAIDAGSRSLRRVAVAAALLLIVAAAGHTALVRRGPGIVRLVYSKGIAETPPIYEKWNSYSRIRVTGDPEREGPAQGWGLSPRVPPSRLRQLHLDIDVWAGTVMTHFDGDLRTVEHLKYDVTNIAYYLRPEPDALVIGAGGGRDVLSALAFGARSVTAVEINTDIIATVNGRFGAFTGHLNRHPGVRFVNDEARSFVARSADRFGTIQISLIDTWAATAAGAFVLGENSLYTVEAWTTFLRHLSDDGLLSVSRWYFRERPAEMYRTTSIAVAALNAIGVTDPRRHIAIVRNMSPAQRVAARHTRRCWHHPGQPASPSRRVSSNILEREAARLAFDVPFSPRRVHDDTFRRLTDSHGRSAFLDGYPVNIAPSTDDRPFFFNMLRLRDIGRPSLLDFGNLSHNMKAVATLGILFVTVTVLTVICILLPLWLTRDRVQLAGAGPLFLFFIAIGLGFMLIETSQMQRLIHRPGPPDVRPVRSVVRTAPLERRRKLSDVWRA